MLGNISIKYKGKTHTVRFNIAARFYLLSKLGGSHADLSKSLSELGTFGLLRAITYAGIVGWAEQNMDQPSLTEKEVSQYLADAPDEKVAEIFESFNEWFLGSNTEGGQKKSKTVSKAKS